MPAIFCVYGKVKIRYNVSMENLRTLLKEQMNIDFMSAVLSGPPYQRRNSKSESASTYEEGHTFLSVRDFPW